MWEFLLYASELGKSARMKAMNAIVILVSQLVLASWAQAQDFGIEPPPLGPSYGPSAYSPYSPHQDYSPYPGGCQQAVGSFPGTPDPRFFPGQPIPDFTVPCSYPAAYPSYYPSYPDPSAPSLSRLPMQPTIDPSVAGPIPGDIGAKSNPIPGPIPGNPFSRVLHDYSAGDAGSCQAELASYANATLQMSQSDGSEDDRSSYQATIKLIHLERLRTCTCAPADAECAENVLDSIADITHSDYMGANLGDCPTEIELFAVSSQRLAAAWATRSPALSDAAHQGARFQADWSDIRDEHPVRMREWGCSQQ